MASRIVCIRNDGSRVVGQLPYRCPAPPMLLLPRASPLWGNPSQVMRVCQRSQLHDPAVGTWSWGTSLAHWRCVASSQRLYGSCPLGWCGPSPPPQQPFLRQDYVPCAERLIGMIPTEPSTSRNFDPEPCPETRSLRTWTWCWRKLLSGEPVSSISFAALCSLC